jgi:serine/threonine protein kinase
MFRFAISASPGLFTEVNFNSNTILLNSCYSSSTFQPFDTQEGEKKEQTEYVVTRWYRAPEIMLGYSTYDYSIDIWSMGCIFGEILSRQALLPGNDYIEQLKLIVNLVGSPSEEDMWYVSNKNARDFMMRLPKTAGQDFNTKFPDASPNAIDLFRKMLTIDPAKRITVDQAILHPFEQPVREAAKLELNAQQHIEVSDIESMELTKPNLQRMMFEEIRLFHEEKSTPIHLQASGLERPSGMALD